MSEQDKTTVAIKRRLSDAHFQTHIQWYPRTSVDVKALVSGLLPVVGLLGMSFALACFTG